MGTSGLLSKMWALMVLFFWTCLDYILRLSCSQYQVIQVDPETWWAPLTLNFASLFINLEHVLGRPQKKYSAVEKVIFKLVFGSLPGGQLYCLSWPQFLHLHNGDNVGIKRDKYVKSLLTCLALTVHAHQVWVSFQKRRSGPLSRDLSDPTWRRSSHQFQTGRLACGQGADSKAFLLASSGLGAAVKLQFLSWSSGVWQGVPSS